jgi:hypothetical protein
VAEGNYKLKVTVIEEFKGRPLDKSASFAIYLGRNIPKKRKSQKIQKVVSDEDLDYFFECQEQFTGYTRVPAKGMYMSESESSEIVYVFGVTLRDVLQFSLDYIASFSQKSVYVEILSSDQFEVKTKETVHVTNH